MALRGANVLRTSGSVDSHLTQFLPVDDDAGWVSICQFEDATCVIVHVSCFHLCHSRVNNDCGCERWCQSSYLSSPCEQIDGNSRASRDAWDDSDDQIDTVDCTRHVVTNKCAKFLIFTLCATRDAPKDCPDDALENCSPNCPSHDIHRSISRGPWDEMVRILVQQQKRSRNMCFRSFSTFGVDR